MILIEIIETTERETKGNTWIECKQTIIRFLGIVIYRKRDYGKR